METLEQERQKKEKTESGSQQSIQDLQSYPPSFGLAALALLAKALLSAC